MSKRFALKAATEDIHQELDDTLSRFDLADTADYARFLGIHARAVPPIEAALDRGGVAALVEGWRPMRSEAIAADLKALGQPMPAPADPPSASGPGALLGMAYVLEGSRLGGQLLRRQVGAGLPVKYLAGARDTRPWACVVAALDRHLYSDTNLGEAKAAARRCFALFLDAAREAVE